MKKLKILHHTAEVIDVLGGNRMFQRKLDATATTVSNWRNLDRFPWREYFPITEALKPLGYRVEQSMFGLSKDVIHKAYSAKKKPRKKKPKPATTGRQGRQNDGANGRNGKRNKVRKRPSTMARPVDQHAQGTMGDLDGGRALQADGAVAQRHHRQGVEAQTSSQEG